LPTENFDQSVNFYTKIGWQGLYRDNRLVLAALGASRIFLQNYYQKEWSDDSMIHLVVNDAGAWFEVAQRVKSKAVSLRFRFSTPNASYTGRSLPMSSIPQGYSCISPRWTKPNRQSLCPYRTAPESTNQQLECGEELEKLSTHKPGCDWIAAGHSFDAGVVELPTRGCFDVGNQAPGAAMTLPVRAAPKCWC
jgi:hypothetical protein